MVIKKTESKKKIHLPDGSTKIAGEKQQKPLLQITLPRPSEGNPNVPVPIGKHNLCAQKNFAQVANVLMAVINNQKLMGLTITQFSKKLKELEKNDKKIMKNIGEFLKENKNVKSDSD